MSLETIEQLNFRINLEKLLEDFREALLEAYEYHSYYYERQAVEAISNVETDVAIRKFIEENCK